MCYYFTLICFFVNGLFYLQDKHKVEKRVIFQDILLFPHIFHGWKIGHKFSRMYPEYSRRCSKSI